MTKYNNTEYWLNIHKQYNNMLKSVGHPFLSENLNRLKYESEADTILNCLGEISDQFTKNKKKVLSILDIGAGIGYWTNLVSNFFKIKKFKVNMTALDISNEALKIIKKHNPKIKTIKKDLKKIKPTLLKKNFDLIISCYCFYHLIDLEAFQNALHFAGESVKPGGFFILVDPILTMPFSKNDTFDFLTCKGNGIARHLYIIDNILSKQGFTRLRISPAVSFILNANIESRTSIGYYLMNIIWRTLCIFYRSENFVKSFSRLLKLLDYIAKKLKCSYSSSVCVYKKKD